MKAEILRDYQIDISDVLRRSPVKDQPQANDILRVYIINSVEFWVGKIDGEIACIFGLIPPTILSDSAYMWLLTTDLVEEHTFMFVRHSQQWMEGALNRYKSIHGHVAIDNFKAKRWLRWLGARILDSEGGSQAFEIRKRQWTL